MTSQIEIECMVTQMLADIEMQGVDHQIDTSQTTDVRLTHLLSKLAMDNLMYCTEITQFYFFTT